MQNPALDLLALSAIASKKALHQPADLSSNHFGNVFCKQDMKSGVAQVKSHRAQGIGKCISFCLENLRPLHLLPADYYSCGAVTKKNRRNQVGLRNIFALKRKRRQLDRYDEDIPAGLRLQIIRSAPQRHSARGAA